MMYGLIYKITNLVNGKIYIGQTTQTKKPRKRWNDHRRAARTGHHDNGCYLYNAIRKHGDDNFMFETIDVAYSKEELDKKEIELIESFQSRIYGYNIALGGSGRGHVAEETKRKISNGNKGLKRTSEMRKRQSEMVKLRYADPANHPMYGKKQSPEHYQKTLNLIHKMRKPVIQFDNSGTIIKMYESLTMAANALDLFPEQIKRCCAGKQRRAGGYLWKFANTHLQVEE